MLTVLNDGWDLFIVHPECTYLCNSGIHWNCRTPGRALKTRKAIEFAESVYEAPINRIGLENPMGVLSTFSTLMKYTQTIQPYDFGEDASKETCLWLKNLPKLVPTKYVEPRWVMWKGKLVPRWANQCDSGQNKEPPSKRRSAIRAETYQGIADAMADQWGGSIVQRASKAFRQPRLFEETTATD